MTNPLQSLLRGSLQVESEKALGMFSKAIANLRKINEAALAKQVVLKIEFAEIQAKMKEVESIHFNNTKVILNIEKILS